MLRIGLNSNGENLGSLQDVIDWHDKARPSVSLMMNNITAAKQFADRYPQTIVIHRQADSYENNVMPIDWRVNRLPYSNVWHHIFNEPEWQGQDLRNLVQHFADIVTASAAQGKRVVIGNWSTGFVQQADIDAGVYDALILVLAQHPEHAILGLHEYGMGVIPNSLTGRDPRDLISGDNLQRSEWMTPSEFAAMPHNSHIGRYMKFVRRAEELNVRPPRIVLTEFGWDRLKDYAANILQHLDNESNEAYADGVITLENFFNRVYPDQSFQDAVLDQLKWANETYTAHVEGLCLFTWNHAYNWRNYNVARLPDLLGKLADYGASQPHTPPIGDIPTDEDDWVDVVIFPYGAAPVRFRAAPNTEAPIIRAIMQRTPAQIRENANTEESSSNWIEFKVSGQNGFIRSDVVGIDWLTEPELPSLDTRLDIALSKLDELRTYLEGLKGLK